MGLYRVTQSSTHGSYNIPLISIANLVGGKGGGDSCYKLASFSFSIVYKWNTTAVSLSESGWKVSMDVY